MRKCRPLPLACFLLLACPLSALASKHGEAVVAGFTQRLQRMTPARDVRCRSYLTFQVGKDKLSQVIQVSLKRPDKLRMDIIYSSVPMLAGWTYIRSGGRMIAYDPISERTVSLDLDQLTDRHPMRLDPSFNMPFAMLDPAQFHITYQGRRRSQGRLLEIVLVRPRRAAYFHGHALAKIELLLQPQALVPVAETAWDGKGRRVMVATFSEPQQVAPGLLAHLRMDLVAPHGRGTIRFQWLGRALVPVSMTFSSPDHKLTITAKHTDFVLDSGIPDRQFSLP